MANYRNSVRVDARLDTVFNGELCLPILMAIQLRLKLIGKSLATYADGRVKAELYFAGKTKVGKTVREVKIALTRGDETILGPSLLRESKVAVSS
ncbi:MAG: hypothetical protein OEY88_06980 [Candidatus Bathyarchaeota archaeon]|nr:hypothetical protein [Candidatus Bathyarchaeota archaeon]